MLATDGADLRGEETRTNLGNAPLGILKAGSREEIDKFWAKGVAAASAVIEGKFDYKPHDPSYELGTDGGQIQNSNSVAYTISKAMALVLGLGRDLLDPKYERYVAPPVFPVRDAP